MAYLINPEDQDLLDSVREFCEKEIKEQCKEYDVSGEWPAEIYAKARMATPEVPILLAASPLAATRSQPTKHACTQPFFITREAMLSQISVTSTPARWSS